MAIPDREDRSAEAKSAVAEVERKKKKKIKVKLKSPPTVGSSRIHTDSSDTARAKKKKPPIPVPSIDATLFLPPPIRTIRPPRPGDPFAKPQKHLPTKFQYTPVEDFFLPNDPESDRQKQINKYNQDRERRRRETARGVRRRQQGIQQLLDKGMDLFEIADSKHLGKNQNLADFIENGKRDLPGFGEKARAVGGAIGRGVKALPGVAKGSFDEWAELDDWVDDIGDFGRRFDKWTIGQGKQFSDAITKSDNPYEAAAKLFMESTDWVDPTVEYGLGSNIAKVISGEEFDPNMLAVEIGLAFVPVKGFPSVFSVAARALMGKPLARSMIMDGRNAKLMSKALTTLFEENPTKAKAIQEALNSGDLEKARWGQLQLKFLVASNKRKLRKIWSPRQERWVESKISTRHWLHDQWGKGWERARKAGVPGFKSGDEMLAKEARYSSERVNKRVRTNAVERIAQIAKKLNPSDFYALRVIAHGLDPLEEADYHRKLGQAALEAEDKAGALRHGQHVLQYEDVANRELVERGEDGLWYINQDGDDSSLEGLRNIERLWGQAQQIREDSYARLGILDQDTVLRRLNAPATEIRKELSGIRQSLDRARVYARLQEIAGPKADSWLDILDARSLVDAKLAREAAQDTLNRLTAEGAPQSAIDEARRALGGVSNDDLYRRLDLWADWREQDIQAILADFSVKTAPDLSKTKRVATLEDGSKIKFSMSQSEADFWDQPWTARLPVLFDRETDNLYFGNPGDGHEELASLYFGDAGGEMLRSFPAGGSRFLQGQVNLENGQIVAIHAPPGVDENLVRSGAQEQLNEFKVRRFGSSDSSYTDPLDIEEVALEGGNYRLPGLSFKATDELVTEGKEGLYYHGLHREVGPNGEVVISGKTPGKNITLGHETLGHFYQDTLGLPKEFAAKLEELGLTGPEDFAKVAEAYLYFGGKGLTPDIKSAMDNVSQAIRQEVKKGKWGLRKQDLPPDHEELFALFDDLHNWQDLTGRFYAPETMGMPTSFQSTRERLVKAFGGAKTFLRTSQPQTLLGSDPSVKKRFRARLMRSGYFKGDITKGITRAGMQASKIMSFADAREALVPLGTPIPKSFRDIPLRVDVSHGFRRAGENTFKIQRLAAILEDLNAGGKVDLNDLTQFDEREFQTLLDAISPQEIAGKPFDEIAAMIQEGEIEPIDNIVWVSRAMMEEAGLVANAETVKIQKEIWQDFGKSVGWTTDQVNNAVKLSILQLNPSYYAVNFTGNTVMNFMQQGFSYVPNTAMAAKLSHAIGEDYARMVDSLMGSGISEALGLRQAGPASFFNEFSNRLVDQIPRRSAWIHEARVMGFDEDWQIKGLLQASVLGDRTALEVLDTITRHAKDAIVDYDRLNNFEKQYVQRVMFFYPWIKGATRWTGQYPLKHPVQATAFAALFAYSQDQTNKEIGDRPHILDLDMILPDIPGIDILPDERDGQEIQYSFNPRQMFTFTTPYDLFRTFASLIPGVEGGSPLAEGFTPVLSAALTSLYGKRLFDEKDVPRDLSTFIDELGNLPPIIPKLVALFGPTDFDFHGLKGPQSDQSTKLYPRNVWDRALFLALGSMAPKPVNVKNANWYAQNRRGQNPHVKWDRWEEEFEEAFGRKPPPEVKTAIESKIEWETMKNRGDKDEDTDEDGYSDTISLSRLEAKIELLMRRVPAARKYRDRMLADARKGVLERREVDSAVESWLGWTSLSSDSENMNEIARASSG